MRKRWAGLPREAPTSKRARERNRAIKEWVQPMKTPNTSPIEHSILGYGARLCSRLGLTLGLVGAVFWQNAHAQGLYPQPVSQASLQSQAEENFRQVFVVSGYSAAFGAALGASMLPFMKDQSMSSVRYVLGGASLGFIVGAAYGFYLVSNAGAATAAPYGYDPYASMRDLAPAERRVVYESLAQPLPAAMGLTLPAYQTTW